MHCSRAALSTLARFRFRYLQISIYMKRRRRLFEPCGADAAGDGRAASSTSPSAPEPPCEAVPHEENACINVLAGCTHALVVHRALQIREALPSERTDGCYVFHDGWAAAVDAFGVIALLPLDEVCNGKKLRLVADSELISAMHDFLQRWEQERFMRAWLAFENEYLPMATLKHTIEVPKTVIEHGKASATTSSRVTQVDTKLPRQSAVNNILLCVKFKDHYSHTRIVLILVHVPWPLRLWQGEAAKERASVAENLGKTMVGHLTHKAFTWSSPEVMSYVHQGLVEMRKVQASTLGTLVKKREYKELLSSSKAARRKQSRRCVVSRC